MMHNLAELIIFSAMIGLILFELVDEVRGSTAKLVDRYHE